MREGEGGYNKIIYSLKYLGDLIVPELPYFYSDSAKLHKKI